MAVKRPRSIRGMISREMTYTTAELRCYDDFNHLERSASLKLTGKYDDHAQILEIARKSGELEMGLIPLEVISSVVTSELRAISIEDFVKYSTVIETN